ncbi:MAG: hypothetical protein KIT72_16220 [Polyangiaceae bacterium]|nr:hypothetical protein [Polyangiaceae bacterium]MCW5791964.1 hypothetical protein [Polyangiaceae bacterium]
MRATGWLFLVPSLLLACAGSPPPPANTAAPEVTAEELTGKPGHLTLGQLSMTHGDKTITLHPDGRVGLMGGAELGTLERSGRFVNASGEVLAELTEEGEIMTGEDDYLPLRLNQDGELHVLDRDQRLHILEDGRLSDPSMEVTFTGVTPETRRAAMFLLVMAAYPISSR